MKDKLDRLFLELSYDPFVISVLKDFIALLIVSLIGRISSICTAYFIKTICIVLFILICGDIFARVIKYMFN